MNVPENSRLSQVIEVVGLKVAAPARTPTTDPVVVMVPLVYVSDAMCVVPVNATVLPAPGFSISVLAMPVAPVAATLQLPVTVAAVWFIVTVVVPANDPVVAEFMASVKFFVLMVLPFMVVTVVPLLPSVRVALTLTFPVSVCVTAAPFSTVKLFHVIAAQLKVDAVDCMTMVWPVVTTVPEVYVIVLPPYR